MAPKLPQLDRLALILGALASACAVIQFLAWVAHG
jgi:hypothetical protein